MDLNIKLEVSSNIEKYTDFLLKAERQIRELKETFKKIDEFKLQFEIKDNLSNIICKNHSKVCVVCGKPSKEGELCSNECADKYREEDRLRRMGINNNSLKCFRCNEELNINNFIAITPREEGHKNLCGDCYVQLSKEKGNVTQPEEENT